MATGYNVPTYDYEVDQQKISRQRQLVDAMMQGALAPMGPTETAAGGVAIKKSPLEGIAKIAQAYLAMKQGQGLDQQQQALGERYRGDLRTGMEGLMQGMSMQPTTPAPDGMGPNITQADAQGAKQRALLEAIGSNHPVLQQLGLQGLAPMFKEKEQMGLKDYLGLADKFDPQSTVDAGRSGDPSRLKPKSEKPIEVGGMLLDPKTLTVLQANGEMPKTVTINGDLYEINPTTKQYKKLDNAPKVTNTTNVRVPVNVVNQGESEFMKELGKSSAADLVEAKKAKHTSQQMIGSMDKLEQLDNSGVFSGPTAQPAMFMGSLAEAIGVPVDKAKLANSQAYQGEVMQTMQQYLTGSLARSTTDKDAEILRAPLPQLINSKEGRAALRRQVKAKAQERIEYADSVQKKLEQQFPEAGRLNSLTPGTQPVPQRTDVGPGRVRRFNPATGKIE
jgi:hypothetical protein